MTSPAGQPSAPSPSGGSLSTNATGGTRASGQPSAASIEAQIQSLMGVQLTSTQAMLTAVKEMTQEIRLGSLRQASASGDREAQSALSIAENSMASYGGQLGDVSRIGLSAQNQMYGGGSATAGQTRTAPGGGVTTGAPLPGTGAGGTGGVNPGGSGAPASPTPAPSRPTQNPYTPYATSGSQLGKRAASDLGGRIRGNTDDENYNPNSARARVGNSIMQSGGTLAGLRQGVLNNIPGFGLAAGVVDKIKDGFEDVQDQVMAGRAIESVEGPQSLASQTSERAKRRLTELQGMFSVGGERAGEQFNFATSLGMTGSERSREMRNMTSVATSTGASEDQVEDAFGTAAKNANQSLTQVADALKNVSSTAKEFHVNAEVARQSYIDLFQTATGQGFGSAASGIAQTQTNNITAMGRSMAGVSTEEGLSTSMLYRYAGQSGQSIGSVYAQSIATNGQSLAQLQTNNTTMMIKAVIPPQIQAWIRDQIQKNGGASAVRQDPAVMGIIAQDMLSTFPNDLNPDFLQTFAKENMGVSNADPIQTLTFIINQFAGNTTAAQAAQTNADHATTTSGLNLSKNSQGITPQTSTTGFANLNFNTSSSSVRNARGGTMPGSDSANVAALGGDKTIADAYLKQSRATNSRNGVVEGLIQTLGKNATKQLVQVHTKDGQRVVTWKDAVEEYQDQLATGEATIVGEGHVRNGKVQVTGKSAYQGQSAQQLLGYTATDMDAKQGAAKEEQAAAGSKDGQSLTASDAQAALAKKGGGNNTTFDLTAAAAAILTPLVNGTASQVSAAGSMSAPANYNGALASNVNR